MEPLQKHRQHPHSYHLEKSLVFQFILSEMLESSKQMKSIAALMPINSEHTGSELKLILQELSGPVIEQMRLITWTSNEGIFTKLKGCCASLLYQTNPQDKASLTMSRLANQLWLQCHNCFHSVNLWEDQTDLQEQLEQLLQLHQRWAKIIAQKIKDFREDENVLFFLLRHHQEFDAVFGMGYVKELLLRLSPTSRPKNLCSIENLIIQKYIKRGFNSLIPIIKSKISELACSPL